MLRSAGGKRSRLLLLLAVAGTARAAEPFSVVALGQADVPSSATVHTMPGQVALRPPRPEPSSLPSPGLVVLVDGKARLLIDPASGTLSAARAAGLDLAEVSAVLLGSMAPASTAELPTLLARRDGPAGEVRLVGPAGPGPWPSPGRWAEALFGPSGLYASTRSAPRSLRLVASEVKPGTERRMSLGSGVELRTRVRTTPDGPRAAFRLERGGTAVVLAGEPSPEALPALTPLARGAALVVASVPDRAAVEALAKLASTAEVRALWVIATGEEVRRTADEERRTRGAAAPLTWVLHGSPARGRSATTRGADRPRRARRGGLPVGRRLWTGQGLPGMQRGQAQGVRRRLPVQGGLPGGTGLPPRPVHPLPLPAAVLGLGPRVGVALRCNPVFQDPCPQVLSRRLCREGNRGQPHRSVDVQ